MVSPPRTQSPGFFSRLIHTPGNTINFIEVAAGNSIALHQHVHYQLSIVLEGEFEMTIDGVINSMKEGDYCHIDSMVQHGGRAITNCKLLDIFNPVREDYRALSS